MPPTTRERDAQLHALATLVSSIIGNIQLARRALAIGATEQPIAAWLRTAEDDARQIAALRQALITTEDA
jgi:hypothetical protein